VEDLEAQRDFALSPQARTERVVSALAEVDTQSLLKAGTGTWRKLLDIGTLSLSIFFFLFSLSFPFSESSGALFPLLGIFVYCIFPLVIFR
jgi:hypothetical protein